MALAYSFVNSSSNNILTFNPFTNCSKLATYHIRKRPSSTRILASSRRDAQDKNYNYKGKQVDENMIVLRKRIHEMKMVEKNYEPPSDWLDWEKKYYTTYDSFICQVLGLLQSQLMNTRPSLALGFLALIVLSVPTSTFVVLLHSLDFVKGLLGGMQF